MDCLSIELPLFGWKGIMFEVALVNGDDDGVLI